ncbi:hypothetical protein [Aurantimonas sp. 22II-16-19i]|uniref:hypothetical protein n=1 Tax=Aurantimonas sp. 22II-16-19i TaxID=1317114 RepID=UPI0009F7B4E7|nr:hypothetical protein [Aurantimonas sp. 22II-16-19i]ORE90566.1 hypothetical protein ATO4_20905 [Aurantimonas sp. 22II-16-19i]
MIQFRTLTPAERAAMIEAHCQAIAGLPTRPLAAEKMFPDTAVSARAMAARMIEIAALSGHCTDADLIEAGYTPDDLARDGQAARQLAYGLSEKQLS